jgi:hypothetical protein
VDFIEAATKPHFERRRMMKSCMAALASVSVATPAFAQHVPSGTPFVADGPAMVDKSPYGGAGPFFCDLSLPGTTGAGGAGGHAGHANDGTLGTGTNTGPTPCPAIVVNPGATFRYDTGLGWVIENLNVSVGGNPSCYHPGPLPFSIVNNGPGADILFSATIYDSVSNQLACDVAAELYTDDIQEVG